MNKQVILQARTNNRLIETPYLFILEIDQQLAHRLRELAQVVDELNVKEISDANSKGCWSYGPFDVWRLGPELQFLPEIISELSASEAVATVEHDTVHVARNGFYFTAIKKSEYSEAALSTNVLPFEMLDTSIAHVEYQAGI